MTKAETGSIFVGLLHPLGVMAGAVVLTSAFFFVLPLIQVIRAQKILEGFPARSTADLYLWLMDHQAELRAQCGPDVDTERAAEHYAERHGRHLLTRATSALRDWLSQDACEWVTTGRVTP